jgi:glutamyl/glutaminyl-tRNA synthetase
LSATRSTSILEGWGSSDTAGMWFEGAAVQGEVNLDVERVWEQVHRLRQYNDMSRKLIEESRALAARASSQAEQARRQAADAERTTEEAQHQRVATPRERAATAKRRELAAHLRAAVLHDQAAELQDRLGHPDRAATARAHAHHARERYELALEEQREQQEWTAAGED